MELLADRRLDTDRSTRSSATSPPDTPIANPVQEQALRSGRRARRVRRVTSHGPSGRGVARPAADRSEGNLAAGRAGWNLLVDRDGAIGGRDHRAERHIAEGDRHTLIWTETGRRDGQSIADPDHHSGRLDLAWGVSASNSAHASPWMPAGGASGPPLVSASSSRTVMVPKSPALAQGCMRSIWTR